LRSLTKKKHVFHEKDNQSGGTTCRLVVRQAEIKVTGVVLILTKKSKIESVWILKKK
jgi:hypothetical protein